MSSLSELTCLQLHRPGLHAAAEQVAAYYDELAEVHEQLAREARTVDEHLDEIARATKAHHRALELRASTTTSEVI